MRPDPSEKLHLSESNLIDVIRDEKTLERHDDEMVRTSIFLSSWVVTAIDVIKKKTNATSERKFHLACMNLGTAVISDNFDKKANEIRSLRDELNWDKNIVIADLANSHSSITLGVDNIKNATRATLQMTRWANDDLAVLAQKLGVQISSLRRIAICYSFDTVLAELPLYIQKYIPDIKNDFVEKVDCLYDMFNRWLITGNQKEDE